MNRRDLLQKVGAILCAAPVHSLLAKDETPGKVHVPGNFEYIYAEPALREAFKMFLVNVFHLYPEDKLHAALLQAVRRRLNDAEIYTLIQGQLSSIKPWHADLTYSLPTLSKQKRVLTEQTVALLDGKKRFDGYLEVGSNGRFLDALEEGLDLEGERFSLSERAPIYSPIDILDRGQFTRAGPFIPLNDYRPALASHVADRSLDLVTVYIGFHHCPVDLRNEFISSIRAVLRPGGTLIVRDHDAHDEPMLRMISLAHDVFNMGTQESWAYNARERRNFYPLATLDRLLQANGFRADGRTLLQDGDPTLNTLMKYTKA